MDEDEEEWKFTLEGGIGDEPLTPETIDPENALFFALGVAFAVAVLVAMAV